MTDEGLSQYVLVVDENYCRYWKNGTRHVHPIARYEIQKGLDIPGVICWIRISRLLYSDNHEFRAIQLSYRDGNYKRRTATVPVNKEKKLRVVSGLSEISDFTFTILQKEPDYGTT